MKSFRFIGKLSFNQFDMGPVADPQQKIEKIHENISVFNEMKPYKKRKEEKNTFRMRLIIIRQSRR